MTYTWPDLSIDRKANEQARLELGITATNGITNEQMSAILLRAQDIKLAMRAAQETK